ncbi:MAG: PIG-L family deacetylase [Clostridia bacterium]|nr:PIG-L family deacetylase [Clostridia bacterium]
MLQILIFAAFLILVLSALVYKHEASYKCKDKNKFCFFKNKTVMIIVPHEDDELNLMGGLYEDLIENKNRLITVFITNGDYLNKGAQRIKEAVKVNRRLGLKKEDIIFLGYGGGWDKDFPNIYNGRGKGTLKSHCGRSKTYGTKRVHAFNDGAEYTTENFFNDLKDVVLSIKPDVIFCSDYDCVGDHALTSLAFDKVMGEILKQESDYNPNCFKGFCYPTAWTAPNDFYALNPLSTLDIKNNKTAISLQYAWGDRIRLPISGLSRSLLGCKTFYALKQYKSQDALFKAPNIINGDKVFWARRTDSVLRHANITVSSGDAKFLNDFMLMDNDDLKGKLLMPYDGVWVPDKNDADKKITITFAEKTDISTIKLYGNLNPDSKILNVKIVLDNGYEVYSGEIKSYGTQVSINQKDIEKLYIYCLDTMGDNAGLSEIEIFDASQTGDGGFIKLCSESGDFVYDVLTDNNVYMMKLYTYNSPALNNQNYTVYTDNKRLNCYIKNDKIYVETNLITEGLITIKSNDGKFSDTIMFRKKPVKKIAVMRKLLNMENKILNNYKLIKYNIIFRRLFEVLF